MKKKFFEPCVLQSSPLPTFTMKTSAQKAKDERSMNRSFEYNNIERLPEFKPQDTVDSDGAFDNEEQLIEKIEGYKSSEQAKKYEEIGLGAPMDPEMAAKKLGKEKMNKIKIRQEMEGNACKKCLRQLGISIGIIVVLSALLVVFIN